jgi:hypothetical protein
METGIPQGSPLSPILFLFFIAELLAELQRPKDGTLGFGFVDDTNLVAWGDTAKDNCRRLDAAHSRCIAWAKRYGATFAPEKYHLIHFTKRRRDPTGDLASGVQIGSHPVKPEPTLRVLGVWVDPKLTWKEHIQRAASKGLAAFEALSCIVTSTWGPSIRRARLLYTAVVRPSMMYAAPTWVSGAGTPAARSRLKPLNTIQNKCLRRITGGYKRTPIAALEREAGIPPLDLYAEETTLQRAAATKDHQVYKEISRTLDTIWTHTKQPRGNPRRARQRPPPPPRPPTDIECAWVRAAERTQEALAHQNHQQEQRGHRPREQTMHSSPGSANRRRKKPKNSSPIASWANLEWHRRWARAASGKTSATWRTPWHSDPLTLYEGLPKHQVTALIIIIIIIIIFIYVRRA